MVTGIALASNIFREQMKNALVAIGAAILATSCCSSLSRLVDPQLRIAPAVAAADYAPPALFTVTESSENFRDASRERDVPVKIYRPVQANGRLPVVIFSHGIGEDRDSYAYLGREWASRGFIAVHITHAGTDKAMLETGYWRL